MGAPYDAIAAQYQRSKHSPLRRYVEVPTFLSLVGDVRGKRVLDLACGDGFYSRKLKAAGAVDVVGVDISAAMIAEAERQERQDPQGIRFVRADVRELRDLGRFDLVAAAYLLHYAPDADSLSQMCRVIRQHLPDGARFVALNENPEQSVEQYRGYEQYGFNKTIERPRVDGAKITYWMVAGKEIFKFEAHHYERATYEAALIQAGFSSIQWHPLRLSDAGIAEHGREYWQEYMNNPPIVGLECRI